MCKLYEKVIELMECNGRRRLGPENIRKLYQHLAAQKNDAAMAIERKPKGIKGFFNRAKYFHLNKILVICYPLEMLQNH